MKNSDVLIVGAGPAGIAAAVRASECGKRVAILDDNPATGGQIWRGRSPYGLAWFKKLEQCGAEILTGTRVITGDAQRRSLQVETANEAFEIHYEDLILATGARELFLPFPGWTLPNVTGVGGLQALVKSGLPVKGKRIVVAGSGPLLLAVASYLRQRGAEVPMILEQADSRRILRFAAALLAHSGKLLQAITLRASLFSTSYQTGAWVEAADGTDRVATVHIRAGGDRESISGVDYLAVAYGLRPNIELAQSLGCQTTHGAVVTNPFQQTSVGGIYCAGEAAGIGGVDLALIEGAIAGYASGGRADSANRLFVMRDKLRRFAEVLHQTFAPRPELRDLPRDDTVVCRCEDVRLAQLKTADCRRSAKLHWRCGMGPCQGRICGPAVEFLFGWQEEQKPVRPPIFPARVASLISEDKEEAAK